MKFEKDNLTVYFKSSEDMSEVPNGSVDLFVSGSLYLGKEWKPYEELFRKIYLKEALRVLKPKGYLLVQQTDAYVNNQVFRRSVYTSNLLEEGFKIIDVKIWKRCAFNFFQPPFSVFFVCVKKENEIGRTKIKNADYLKGIWDYPQTAGSELNSWNSGLCDMILSSFTKEGDTILDPLAGTSRLLSIASKKGRRAIGYETNERLFDTIARINYDPYSDTKL